jgi:hypothetical protein
MITGSSGHAVAVSFAPATASERDLPQWRADVSCKPSSSGKEVQADFDALASCRLPEGSDPGRVPWLEGLLKAIRTMLFASTRLALRVKAALEQRLSSV